MFRKRYVKHEANAMIRVELGDTVKTGYNPPGVTKAVYVSEKEKVTIIAAKTKYGKSVLVDILAVHIAKHRPIIIFDYRGEHENLKYPSFDFLHNAPSDSIAGLIIVPRPSFYISDLSRHDHWESLGFPELAAKTVAELARDVSEHANEPDAFEEILYRKVRANPHDLSLRSAYRRFQDAKFMFATPYEIGIGAKKRITDFGKLVYSARKVLVNLELHQLGVEGVARCITGILLEQLEPWIERLHPTIIIEEADILCPRITDTAPVPLSLARLSELCLKKQKYGVELIFVTQRMKHRLNEDAIISNAHTLILGQLTAGDYYVDRTSFLKWDRLGNYREFIMLNVGQRYAPVFTPVSSPVKTLGR